jgi:peptide/nickel transport system substrate-binding protein
MEMSSPPFDDPRVRKALRLAVDRAALTKLVLGEGGGTVSCDTPVWPGDPYRWNGDCPRDVGGAKKLLTEAGYPDGIDVEIFTSDVEENMTSIVEAYQAQAAEAGIRVKLTMTAANGYWDDVWMKKPLCVDSWGQRPAAQVLNEVYRSTAAWNPTGWKDAEFDALLDRARSEPDFDKRKAMYIDLQKMLFERGAIFLPYHKNLLRVFRSNVKGIEPVVVDAIRWEKISVE